MKPSVDEIVLTDANREAFELVIDIAQQQDGPVNAYIYGESGSGKTFALQTRALEKDLLSTKTILFSHAAELMTAVQFEAGDRILEKVGSADVLLLDSFDVFFNEIPSGPLLCKLLLIERQSHGLSTVIAGKKPLAEYDLTLLGGVMDVFEEYQVAPLQKSDYLELAKKIQAGCTYGKEDAVVLSDDALEYVAYEFAKQPKDIKSALLFLLTVADYPSGTVIDTDELRNALGCSAAF